MPKVEPPRTLGSTLCKSGFAGTAGLLLALCVGGCPFVPQDIPIDAGDNNTFATASVVDLGRGDAAEFTATIDSSKDTDMFSLGSLAPGDRLFIDVETTSGNLDPLAAVFDERQYIHAFNDDRTPDASNLNPQIDVIIRGAEGPYYLGVAPFPGTSSTGEYRVMVRVTRAVGLPDPEAQTVYLNWEGGQDIVIENIDTYDLDPFDAAALDPALAGQTEPLKDLIEQGVAERYEGFDFVLLNSDDHPEPAEPHSTVYFGGKNRMAFAIAEKIDTHNADQADDAIIFVGSFDAAFSVTPTLQQMATAIANTVAHEVGHLLGLVHTKDCSSLMDSTCGNDSILASQAFKLAPLDQGVFPIGFQSALELLEWTLGLAGI